jgi:N-methylhydantoinase A
VVLGRINPEYFLGGEMSLDAVRAREAIEKKVAQPLGMGVVEAASGICQIVDANMANALRSITIQKGYDPRDYAMIAFGGAGPTHAASLALELGIKTVVIPSLAAVQSAFGIMASDVVHTFSISDVMEIDDAQALNRRFSQLEEQGLELLRREGFSQENIEIHRQVEMRYKGQVHEVTVPVPSGHLSAPDLQELIQAFEQKYQSLYGKGTAFSEAGYEIVTLRVDTIGRTRKPVLPQLEVKGADPSHALKTKRDVVFGRETLDTKIYDGNRLEPGNTFAGPAIVEYPATTAVVHPGQSATVDPLLNLIIVVKDK